VRNSKRDDIRISALVNHLLATTGLMQLIEMASSHQGSPNPSSTRISPFAGLTEWSC
jgi:hypothetical protein